MKTRLDVFPLEMSPSGLVTMGLASLEISEKIERHRTTRVEIIETDRAVVYIHYREVLIEKDGKLYLNHAILGTNRK